MRGAPDYRKMVYQLDPYDAWNREQYIGNAELAARIHSSILLYDKTGNILLADSFETATDKFQAHTVGAAALTKTSNYAFSGNYSLRANLNNIVAEAGPYYEISDFHVGKIGAQGKFLTDGDHFSAVVFLTWYEALTGYQFGIQYFDWTPDIQIWTGIGAWTPIATANTHFASLYNWGTIKLVVDLENLEYIRGLVFGQEVDLRGQTPVAVAGQNHHITAEVWLENQDIFAKTGYIDDIVITENER